MERKGHTISFSDTGVYDIFLPKGSIFHVQAIPTWFKMWIAPACFSGDIVTVKNMSGGIIFYSCCLVDEIWVDRMTLNCDVRGINIEEAMGLATGDIALRIYLPVGSSR